MFQQYQSPNYATFGQRFLAYLIDGILMGMVFLPMGFILGAVLAVAGLENDEALTAAASLVVNILSIIATWLYSAILESSVWQATLGKKVFGIRVTDLSGNRIGFGTATGRHFGKYLSSIICSIGFIMAAFTEKKQGLHDMLASTLVVSGGGAASGVTLDQPPPLPPDFRHGG
ncbi:MAG TPA: RDD family protein [Pyrinomonadaceae bacterium]|nr:RDD family protein [Pyrinomonadaceae bacterium]